MCPALASVRFPSGLAPNATLELLEYGNRPKDNETPIQQNYLGAMHLAFHVDNIDEKVAELRSKGVEFLSDTHAVDEGVLSGWRWVYFHDPDKIPLELVEVAYYDEAARKKGIAEYLAVGRTDNGLCRLLTETCVCYGDCSCRHGRRQIECGCELE